MNKELIIHRFCGEDTGWKARARSEDLKVFPENSLEGLAHHLSLYGPGGPAQTGELLFESDLCITKDGVPVLFHDLDTLRVTGVDSSIDALTFEETQKLELAGPEFDGRRLFQGEGFRIPSLEKGLRDFPEARFSLDIKPPPASAAEAEKLIAPILAVIDRYEARGRVTLTSHHKRTVKKLTEMYTGGISVDASGGMTVSLAFLFSKKLIHWLNPYVLRLTYMQFPVLFSVNRSADFVRMCKEFNWKVAFYVIDSPPMAAFMLQKNSDAIMTNQAHLIAPILNDPTHWKDIPPLNPPDGAPDFDKGGFPAKLRCLLRDLAHFFGNFKGW